MTTKPNQAKRLYWYIVLATVVLLTCFGVRPKTADSKTIITGSFALQHDALGVDHNDTRAKRHLRSNANMTEKIDGDNEDRGFNALAMKIEEVAETAMWKVYDYIKTFVTSKNQITTDERFKSFEVDKINIDKNTGDLFKSDEFQMWAKFVDSAYKKDTEAAEVAKISTLLSKYGDDMVVNMLAAGKKVASTKAVAENLEIGLVITWTKNNERVNDAFNLLMAGKDESELLKSPLMSTWMSYASATGKKLLLKKFEKRYNQELAEVLVGAKKNVATEKNATELEKLQLEEWQANGKSINDAFELLKLSSTTLLKSPVLSTWFSYVEMLKKNPYDVLFLAMKEHVDDIGRARMFAAAKRDGTNANIVSDLELLQLKEWSEAQRSGKYVFKLLRLQNEGENAPNSPLWDTWVSYMTTPGEFPSKQTKNPETLLFPVLRNQFSDEVLTKLVAKAKTVERTKELAAKWELGVWWINGQTLDDVFDLLKLKEKGDAVFESPEFRSWKSYLEKSNSFKKTPAKYDLISELEKHYGFQLEKMLTRAMTNAIGKNDKSTKKIVSELLKILDYKSKIIERIEADLTEGWWATHKTPDDVFDLLKLKQKGDAVFESLEFTFWVSYVNKLNALQENPRFITNVVVSELEKHYGSGLEVMLKRVHLNAILKENKTTTTMLNDFLESFSQKEEGNAA